MFLLSEANAKNIYSVKNLNLYCGDGPTFCRMQWKRLNCWGKKHTSGSPRKTAYLGLFFSNFLLKWCFVQLPTFADGQKRAASFRELRLKKKKKTLLVGNLIEFVVRFVMSWGVSSLSSRLVCSLVGSGKKKKTLARWAFLLFLDFSPHLWWVDAWSRQGEQIWMWSPAKSRQTSATFPFLCPALCRLLGAPPVFLAQTKSTFVAYLPAPYNQTVKRHLLPTKPFAYLCTHNWFCVISPGKCQRDNWATAVARIKPSVKVW